jgi:hypothetical protein
MTTRVQPVDIGVAGRPFLFRVSRSRCSSSVIINVFIWQYENYSCSSFRHRRVRSATLVRLGPKLQNALSSWQLAPRAEDMLQ